MSSNQFNTTPDGTTVIDIPSIINLSTTLVITPTTTPYIDNIILLNPSINIFVFSPGNYKLITILKINKNGIKFVGLTGIAKDVQVEQTMNFDGILIQGNNIVLQDISLTCTFSLRNCLIAASANNTLVSGCAFYCTNDTFGVYYAGPSTLTQGQGTLDAYTNYNLDTGNIFYNNIVYTDFSGDSVSFGLQYKSQFVNNFIRGGKVAIYMCRTCNVYNNTLMDSTTNGFYISFPSDNLLIVSNTIGNTTYSGVVMKNQMEHGSFTTYPYNIFFRYNTIFGSKFYGLEINNAKDVTVSNNTIVSSTSIGIYSYASDTVSIISNKIAYFTFGIFFENGDFSTIKSNKILSIYPNIGNNGIKLTNTSTDDIVKSNNLYGSYKYDLIANSGTGNTISSNGHIKYYTINEERNVYKII